MAASLRIKHGKIIVTAEDTKLKFVTLESSQSLSICCLLSQAALISAEV